MQPLTHADRDAFIAQGYLHVPNVVPRDYCERVIAALCAFIEVDPEDAATWREYVRTGRGRRAAADATIGAARSSAAGSSAPRAYGQGHGIVPLHHHQALWDVRQLQEVHALFSVLLDTPKLWVSLDRVSFKVPEALRAEPFRMDAVHWDGDPRGDELAVQGLIYLTDTPAGKGAFAMVPELYRNLDEWLAAPRAASELRRPDVAAYPLVPLGGAQGSMVLWHRRMAHTSLANDTTQPRYVQYVTMSPAGDDSARTAFAELTRDKRAPPWALRQQVPGQLDPEPGPTPVLTPLGRRLAGIDAW